MNIKKILFLATLLSGILITTGFSATLSFGFMNIEKVEGKIYLMLVEDEESFQAENPAEDKVVYQTIVQVANKDIRLSVTGLKPGNYAALMFQDLNGNGKLDTNSLKIPTEPYGFSNNVKGLFGKPKFKDAQFTLADKDVYLQLKPF